jgi:hypothetical protein
MSLVQGQSLRRHVRMQLEFGAAFLLTCLVVFALMWLLGDAISRTLTWLDRGLLVLFVIAPFLVLELVDVGNGRSTCSISRRRQTPKRIAYEHGWRRTAWAWGVDTGSVVSTYRVSAATWAALALTGVGAGFPWLGGVYALAFVGPLLVLTSLAGYSSRIRRRLLGELPLRPSTRALRALAASVMLTVAVASL